jgi:hypothetical protein
MNLSDQQKKLVVGGIALIAILVIVLFVVRSRRRPPEAGPAAGGFVQPGQEGGAAAGPAAGPAARAGGVAVARGRRGGAAGGAVGAAGLGAGAAGEAPAAPSQYPSIGVVKMGIGPAEPTREDAFLTFNPPIPPIPQEVLYPLPAVGLVAGGLRPGGITEVARVGNRRVAGLLFDDQAWAILEDEPGIGQAGRPTTYIVKPGDVVDGIRITAIARDAIFLKDREGNKWEVPLRGLGPGGRGGVMETSAAGVPEMPPV